MTVLDPRLELRSTDAAEHEALLSVDGLTRSFDAHDGVAVP